MIHHFLEILDLSLGDALTLTAICFVAGMVRGFSGFALSAMVMASAVTILPPVMLIPICWWLEIAASVLMVRGGFKDANKKIAISLAIGSGLGVPIGLFLTTNMDAETSKLVALILVATLAALLVTRLRIPGLDTNLGLAAAGLSAGIATGIASIGGMVVALYVLARNIKPREMRGSLILFLCIGSATSLFTFFVFDVMDRIAIARGLTMIIPASLGVIAGKLLFIPAWEKYYKPFCLILLIVLALSGILRLGVS